MSKRHLTPEIYPSTTWHGKQAGYNNSRSSPEACAAAEYHHSQRPSAKPSPFSAAEEVSVAFRQVIRSILHPIGCVQGETVLDRQSLFTHAVKSLGLSADHAGNELRRVNQEPPPDYILHACVVAVKTRDGEDFDGNVSIRFKTGGHTPLRVATAKFQGSLDAISENEALTESRVKTSHRVSIGQRCALAIENKETDEVRMDISCQNGSVGQEFSQGKLFVPIKTINTVGMTSQYDVTAADSPRLLCRAVVEFQFELKGLVIDVGQQDNQKLYLSVCQCMMQSQLTDVGKQTVTMSPTPSACDSGYPSDVEEPLSPGIRLAADSPVRHDTQVILDCLAMQQQIPDLSSMAYLIEALFSCALTSTVPWNSLTNNLLQLDKKYTKLKSLTNGRISSRVIAAVRQCLLSIYHILLRKAGETRSLFPPLSANADAMPVLMPIRVMHALFRCEIWTSLVVDSDEGLGIKLQLTQVLESAARGWYTSSIAVSATSDTSVCNILPVCQAFSVCLKKVADSYSRGSSSYSNEFEKVDMDYWHVCLSSLEKLIHEDLSVLAQNSSGAIKAINAASRLRAKDDVATCYELCRCLFQLVETGIYLSAKRPEVVQQECDQPGSKPSSVAHPLHVAMEAIIPHWLLTVNNHCKNLIDSAIAKDKVTTTSGAESLGISLSAQELVSTVDQLSEHWEAALDWPEPVIAFLIVTRLLDVTCDCAVLVSTHSQRSMRNWPTARFFSTTLDLTQPLIAMNNVGHAAAKVRDLPKILHLDRGNLPIERGTSPISPRHAALSSTAVCSRSMPSSGLRNMARPPSTVFTDYTETLSQALTKPTTTMTPPIIRRIDSNTSAIDLPDVVPPAVGLSRESGIRRSRSFKERKSPMTTLGVTDSPAIVRRRKSLRATSPSTARKRLSVSSPELHQLGNAVDAGAKDDRQTSATKLIVSNCLLDLNSMLMQMGQQIMNKYASLIDQPLGGLIADLPDAKSDIHIGVAIVPLLDYIKTVVSSIRKEMSLHELAQQGLLRGLWNIVNIRLLALLSATDSPNRKLLTNVLTALTMNDGVMSFLCRELGVTLKKNVLQTPAFLALKNFIEVKSASDEGLLLLYFNSVLAKEVDWCTGSLLNIEVETTLKDVPCLRVLVRSGEAFKNLEIEQIALESFVECALLPREVQPTSQKIDVFSTVAKKGDAPHFDTTFNIPFQKDYAAKQQLLREGLLVFSVKVYKGATTESDEYYSRAGLCLFKLSRLESSAGGYSCQQQLPVMRTQRHTASDAFASEFQRRASTSRENMELWSAWRHALCGTR